jgi:hypothetical protein
MNGTIAGAAGVAEQAADRLRESPYQALKDLCCAYREGVLTLRGRLPSYYLKQLALALVGRVQGIGRIEDEIEVVRPAHPQEA